MKWITNILFFVIIALSCTSNRNLEQLNLAHVYQEDAIVLRPKLKVYNNAVDSSIVFFEGSSDQLLYVRDPESNHYSAHLKIKYKLYSDYQRTTLIDSGSTSLVDSKPSLITEIITSKFGLYYKTFSEANKYILEVVLTDLNRNLSYVDIISIDKSDKQTRQNFLLTTPSNCVVFQNHYPLNTPFLLTHQSGKTEFLVRYYNRNFPLAATPYANNVELSFKYTADSTFRVDASSPLVLKKSGFYHFQLDETTKQGFTLFNFYNEYPLITRRQNLGPPLRYLTTKSEYADISKLDDQEMKLEVDKFWLRMAGNVDRGKLLVGVYYNRVETCNMHFTSYLEGWKTDRGIVYTILGAPTEVTRNEFQETWVYGDPNSSLSYVFTFTKLVNPFTDNDYALNRSSKYRYGWSQAIESWRNGRVFDIKEIKRAQDERDRQTRVSSPAYFWY